ncbi:N-terminal acetyltransferase A, auxiliary subunit [Parasponia andersonii]|uniref:N-terminal acetyltransferase A, auxiliary subunit n=1 Tax=Parasponia andersonii TaxID=3476 RepID=A0A2P5BLU8_PARAD|nr:N-terminal acetyltransferase A, auxiliary subunit [Parasponia andersonii]
MAMVTDILLQAVLILVSLVMFLALHNIPQKLYAKFRYRNRAQVQSKRHFVLGAQLLARARSANSRSAATPLAKEALAEAERSIELDPKDAAAHILKALVLDFQGFKSSAIDSIDAALSPLAVKSLTEKERGDALFKRAELKIAMPRRGKVDSALADLGEAVALSPDNARAFCLLGECYEVKKMEAEARKAYEDALRIEPELGVAQQGLDRLSS